MTHLASAQDGTWLAVWQTVLAVRTPTILPVESMERKSRWHREPADQCGCRGQEEEALYLRGFANVSVVEHFFHVVYRTLQERLHGTHQVLNSSLQDSSYKVHGPELGKE